MTDQESDALRARLEVYVGKPMAPPSVAPDPVNVPMIRHWVDALDDQNPVYLDEELAATTRHGGIVAPPAMLQTWSMARPRIEGIAERGGSPVEISRDNPIIAGKPGGAALIGCVIDINAEQIGIRHHANTKRADSTVPPAATRTSA